MFDFETMIDRKNSDSIKWRKYKDKDIIPMWVADMDFPSPPAIMQALHDRISHGIFGYAMPNEELAQTICIHLENKYKWHIEPRWVVWLPGLVCGLNVACRSVGTSQSSVVTNIPAYPPFLSAPKNANRHLITSPMIFSGGNWQIDFDRLSSEITQECKLFILCNPHNPTGRVFQRRELMELVGICESHDLVICSDEIHCDLVLEPGKSHIPLASLGDEVAERTITLMAPSKTYNIPGLGCAFAIISNDRLRRRFKQSMNGIVPHVNILGLVAAQAAFEHGENWLKELLAYLKNNRDLVIQSINQLPGLYTGPVEATYLAWIDARQTGLDQPERFFRKHGVGMSDGADFNGQGFVRLNFGCSRQLLKEALGRIADAVGNMQSAPI